MPWQPGRCLCASPFATLRARQALDGFHRGVRMDWEPTFFIGECLDDIADINHNWDDSKKRKNGILTPHTGWLVSKWGNWASMDQGSCSFLWPMLVPQTGSLDPRRDVLPSTDINRLKRHPACKAGTTSWWTCYRSRARRSWEAELGAADTSLLVDLVVGDPH